ncbi:MAG: hypothetical protein ACRD1H_10175, partial [Vicinamibacterales bacterium]
VKKHFTDITAPVRVLLEYELRIEYRKDPEWPEGMWGGWETMSLGERPLQYNLSVNGELAPVEVEGLAAEAKLRQYRSLLIGS